MNVRKNDIVTQFCFIVFVISLHIEAGLSYWSMSLLLGPCVILPLARPGEDLLIEQNVSSFWKHFFEGMEMSTSSLFTCHLEFYLF